MQKLAATAALVTNVACDHACGTGYAVVDPMPVPGRNVARFVVATVAFTEGGARIVLDMKDPTSPAMVFSAKSDAGTDGGLGALSGGKLVSSSITPDGMRFELEPDFARGAAYVAVDVDGPNGKTTIEAQISWGAGLDGGRALVVTVVDR